MQTLDHEMRELLAEFLASGDERAGGVRRHAPCVSSRRRTTRRCRPTCVGTSTGSPGAGAIYDIAPLTSLGRRGEDLVTVLINEQRPPSASEFAYCRQLVEQIRRRVPASVCRIRDPPSHAPALTVVGGTEAHAARTVPEAHLAQPTRLCNILIVDDDAERAAAADPVAGARRHHVRAHRAHVRGRARRIRRASCRTAPSSTASCQTASGYDVVRELRQRESDRQPRSLAARRAGGGRSGLLASAPRPHPVAVTTSSTTPRRSGSAPTPASSARRERLGSHRPQAAPVLRARRGRALAGARGGRRRPPVAPGVPRARDGGIRSARLRRPAAASTTCSQSSGPT